MSWIIISILIIAIDRISKYIVIENIAPGEMMPIIDKFFYITLHKNPGAAWGILQNSQIFFLIIIPIIAAFILYYMIKSKNRFLQFSLALILGGAAGNYIDRLFEGRVTDFLLFYIGSYPFPIFNAADMAITCGTVLLAVYMLFIYKEPPKKSDDATESCSRVESFGGTDGRSQAVGCCEAEEKIREEKIAEDKIVKMEKDEAEGQGEPNAKGEMKDAE